MKKRYISDVIVVFLQSKTPAVIFRQTCLDIGIGYKLDRYFGIGYKLDRYFDTFLERSQTFF